MYILTMRYHSKNIRVTFTFLPPFYVFIQILMMPLLGRHLVHW